MAFTLGDFDKIWASTSPLTPYEFSDSNYQQGWNFIGATPPERQMWDFLQKRNDEKTQWLYNNKLSLSDGTMTGILTIGTDAKARGLMGQNGTNCFRIASGEFSYTNAGAFIHLFSQTADNNAGNFQISAHNFSTEKALIGKPDGTLTWDGSNVITAAGGTMTGNIFFNEAEGRVVMSVSQNEAGRLRLLGGSGIANGAQLLLSGKSNTSTAGQFQLGTNDGTNGPSLIGKPDGTLTWNGQSIQTTSDKRLKTDFFDVPDGILEAWGKVEWKQFKYIADKKHKGDSCRIHTGLVAQDVQEVCGDEILKYGILCHDVQEATEEQEAVDLWTVRYEEALAMEAAYQRRRADKLEERIAKLESLLSKEK